jgi:predicted ribosome quality control (RQC) complex YloA/Tae2 family protein
VDDLLLTPYIAELAPLLTGARIEKAYQYGTADLALRLWLRPERKTLLLSADPTTPLVALIDHEPAEPRERWALLEAVRSRVVPGTIARVEKVADERIVVFHLASGAAQGKVSAHRLVAELIPRRSCLLLLDEEDRVVAGTGPGLPGPRGLGTGKLYVPPAPAPAGTDRGDLAGLSRLVAREVEARALQDAVDLATARQALFAAARDEPAPTLTTLPGGRVVATPVPFLSIAGTSVRFPSLRELVAAYYAAAVVVGREDTLRARLRAAVARRRERLERTRARVAAEAGDAASTGADRQAGELLLAYQATATVVEGKVVVPHPEIPEATLTVPLLAPELDLVGNAQRYFERYRTRQRATAATARRSAELDAEREQLEEIDAALETAELADLPALEAELRADGILGGGAPAATPKAGRRPQSRLPDALSPREFRSTGGAAILVGRSNRGNAHLTFVLAREHDFWLHAEGPGAHVVLRNEARAETPPAEDLLEAAALAAWFSKLRGATRAEVNWTERRQVERIRGGPPGRVLLRRHHSIRVAPALAAERFSLSGSGHPAEAAS